MNNQETAFTIRQPSPKQKTYILHLAKTVGITVDLSKIEDKKQASELIEKLRYKKWPENKREKPIDDRNKRISFGLATKLVFRRYVEARINPMSNPRFWHDVKAFYQTYQREQETAIAAPPFKG